MNGGVKVEEVHRMVGWDHCAARCKNDNPDECRSWQTGIPSEKFIQTLNRRHVLGGRGPQKTLGSFSVVSMTVGISASYAVNVW